MISKTKLLIVDDNPEVTSSINNYFILKDGFEVIGIAGDALEAIEIMDRQIPDVIILDLIMPKADGFCLLEKVRSQAYKSRPKIIILSCLSHESIISRASSLGADFYIVKPFSLDVLHNRVIEVCNKEYTISNRQKQLLDSGILEARILDIFSAIGIPENSKGRKYLLDCLMASIEDPESADNLSKVIYPKVGLINGTNAYNIEKTIRYMIQLTWEKSKGFNAVIKGLDPQIKPTNKRFIKSILQQLLP